MTVQWISELQDNDNHLIFRKKNESEWKTIEGRQMTFPHSVILSIHQVELTDLSPYTDYVFKFRNREYLFRTMPENLDNPVKFVEGGDMYHDDMQYMTQTCVQAAKTNPDFALLGGDLAYAVGRLPIMKVDRWVEWVITWHKTMVTPENRMIPVIACIGNHDLLGQYNQTPSRARIFSRLFPMPGPQIYNVLDFGNYLSLILLDSGHATAVGGEQTEWLKSVLQSRRNMTYRFAAYHIPAYPSIKRLDNTLSTIVRKHWIPLFEKEGLQVAFEHHDHAYKRTFPLMNNKPHPQGVVYMGDGAWGVKKARSHYWWWRKPAYLAKFVSSPNFILATLKSDGYQFLSIDRTGKILDHYEGK
jgi:acid phosphatase type 7